MLLQQIVNGLIFGLLYSLIALGYTLVFGSLEKLNVAHGENMMVGGYFGILLSTTLHLSFIPLLILCVVLSAGVGVFIYLVSFHWISPTKSLASLVSTLALAAALRTLVVNLVGSNQKAFPELISVKRYSVGTVTISSTEIVVVVASLGVLVALFWMLKFTKTGNKIRAIAENSTTASLLGIRVKSSVAIMFAVGGGLAGLCGFLYGLRFGAITPFMGIQIGLKGIAVMIVGGLGSLRGAVVAALVIGVGETLTEAYLGASYRDAFGWLLMLVVLLVRPQGLFGSAAARAKA